MKKTLGVTWMNGRLKAAVCQGVAVKASWECPRPVEHIGELAPQLRAAIQATRYAGTDVILVLDHRQLIYHLQETPPGKPATLRPFIQRKILQGSFFDEEAAWSFHRPVPAQSAQRFLLTLLPRSVMTGLNAVCAELGLSLTGTFSPAAVLARQFKCLHLKPAEAALLAADLGESLCLVAGLGDGQILFCRHISGSTAQNQIRAAQEINRTLLYVQQKFGHSINTLWVYGGQIFTQLSELKIREGMAVRQSPVQESPFYFNSAASVLSPLDSVNLVSTQEIRRRHFRRQLAAACTGLLACGIASTLITDRVAAAREADVQEWTRKWNALEHYRDQLLFRQREVILLERQLELLGSPEDPPQVSLFIRHLAQVIPETVKLTGVSVSRKFPGYQARLEGYTRDPGAPVLPVLETLEEALHEGVFRLEITESTRLEMLGTGSAGAGSSRHGPHQRLPQGQRRFFIVGHWQ